MVEWSRRKATELLFDSKGTLSLARVAIAFGAFNIWCIVWIYVGSYIYVVRTSQMTEAAPLFASIAQLVGALGVGNAIVSGVMYWVQSKAGGGISAIQLDGAQTTVNVNTGSGVSPFNVG